MAAVHTIFVVILVFTFTEKLCTEKKLHPESYFWSFSTLVPGIIKR